MDHQVENLDSPLAMILSAVHRLLNPIVANNECILLFVLEMLWVYVYVELSCKLYLTLRVDRGNMGYFVPCYDLFSLNFVPHRTCQQNPEQIHSW